MNKFKWILIFSIIAIVLTYLTIDFVDHLEPAPKQYIESNKYTNLIDTHTYTKVSIVVLKDETGNITILDIKDFEKNYSKVT